MRREGYELQVSKPKAIMKEIDGVLCEPYEEVTIEAPDDCIGAVIESLDDERVFVICFPLVTLTVKSLSLLCSPTIIPSLTSTPGPTNITPRSSTLPSE